MYSQQTFLYNGKTLRMDHPEEMPLNGGLSHSVLTTVTFHSLEDLQYCTYSQQTLVHRISTTHIVSYCSCALEWWDVRTPGAILNVFDFLDYTYFKISISLIGERAKRARHSQVCSIENRGYIYIYIYSLLHE